MRKIFTTGGAAMAIAMIAAALWIWRHPARLTSGESDVQLLAVRAAAVALAAAAQALAIRFVLVPGRRSDRVLNGLGLAAALLCAVCVVSAAALGLAAR